MEPQLLLSIFGFLFAVAVFVMIGAGLLSGAVALYNFFAARSKFGVEAPELEFSRAALVMLVVMIVNSVVSYLIYVTLGPVFEDSKFDLAGSRMALLAQVGSILLGLFVMAAILTFSLPTTFARAMLVSLCYLMITIAAILALVAVIAGSWYAFEALE